jgi:dienelactone hydrolase
MRSNFSSHYRFLSRTLKHAAVVRVTGGPPTSPFVDSDRIAIAGCSFGGSLALFSAERTLSIRAVVNFAGAAVSWKQSADLRERMLAAARRARVSILLVQAENDYDLGPTHAAAQQLAQANKPHKVALFPAHGSTTREGHNFCDSGGTYGKTRSYRS